MLFCTPTADSVYFVLRSDGLTLLALPLKFPSRKLSLIRMRHGVTTLAAYLNAIVKKNAGGGGDH